MRRETYDHSHIHGHTNGVGMWRMSRLALSHSHLAMVCYTRKQIYRFHINKVSMPAIRLVAKFTTHTERQPTRNVCPHNLF